MVVTTAALFYAYARRRIGNLAALAPALVLLVFGSDYLHVIAGNGFTIQLALSCGLGAAAAARAPATEPATSSPAVCSASASPATPSRSRSSPASPSGCWTREAAAAAVGRSRVHDSPSMRSGRLWALGQFNSSGEQVSADQPARAALLGLSVALVGARRDQRRSTSTFAGGLPRARADRDHETDRRTGAGSDGVRDRGLAGPASARRTRPLVRSDDRDRAGRRPWSPTRPGLRPAFATCIRGAVAVLLVAIELLRGTRWRPLGVAALSAVAAIGAATNIVELRDGRLPAPRQRGAPDPGRARRRCRSPATGHTPISTSRRS